ncbi:MAG: PIN domain-containing protein [Chloroflexota bacterium]|nr:PIN domain-containing protein [Chloroflexota bacterium]
MKIYLDACCLNRPFDDQTQTRIRLESESILLILRQLHNQEWEWVSSDVIPYEILQTPDAERRERVRLMASFAHEIVHVDENVLSRGEDIQSLGFDAYDALHLACAKVGQVDVFLTTDDNLVQLAERKQGDLQVYVANPLGWLEKMAK